MLPRYTRVLNPNGSSTELRKPAIVPEQIEVHAGFPTEEWRITFLEHFRNCRNVRPSDCTFPPLTSRRICQGTRKLKTVGRRSLYPPSRSIRCGGATSLGKPLRVNTPTSQTAGRAGRLSPVYRTTPPVYPHPENLRTSQHGRG